MSDLRRKKDMEMAAMLKRLGIERTTGKCAMCNGTVTLRNMYNHIVKCRGILRR